MDPCQAVSHREKKVTTLDIKQHFARHAAYTSPVAAHIALCASPVVMVSAHTS